MMDLNTHRQRSFGARCLSLSKAAHAVRQQAIRQGHDLGGWRLSRLMRDADTITQVKSGERDYRVWLISHPIPDL